MKNLVSKLLKVVLPLLLGGFVMYWVYRDFDFELAADVLANDTDWLWMTVSLLAGVMANVIRGIRWKMLFQPLNHFPDKNNCIDAVFVSYAANLVIPRVGEVSRCGILTKCDGIPFGQSLGTVVTERVVDMLCMLILIGLAFLIQSPALLRFFAETGTKIPSWQQLIASPWFYVSLFCVIGVIVLAWLLLRTIRVAERVKGFVLNTWEGINSLRKITQRGTFAYLTVAIWLLYYVHFAATFYCFSFTTQLDWAVGLVVFVAGTLAVIVPTPNGAGPWHFAVITMLMLYGVSATHAALFALVVHGIQTLLVILTGLYGWLHLQHKNPGYRRNH